MSSSALKNLPQLRVVSSAAEARPAEAGNAPAVDAARLPEQTLAVLYARYAPYIGALASRMLGRAAEVEDVVQDVFAAAVRGLRRRENEQEIKGWLAKVAVRRCMRELQWRRIWSVAHLDADASYERLPDPGASTEERLLVIEVYRALDRVPAKQRIPWTLHHVEGEQLEQVAELCGCSLATIKRRIARAHDRLNYYLGERKDA